MLNRELIAREALEHLPALRRLARCLSGNTVDAEDLVQETYAHALAAAPTFDGRNLRAWLFRILRNAFVDGRRQRRRTVEIRDEDEPAADEAPFSREPLLGDVEIDALRGAVASDIERALATLSSDARDVVLLDFEGFTETESATRLGCAVGTVKSRLARARRALRRRLGGWSSCDMT
jgi:RNA polymerase sigma-70 factor (ECF subfamily)